MSTRKVPLRRREVRRCAARSRLVKVLRLERDRGVGWKSCCRGFWYLGIHSAICCAPLVTVQLPRKRIRCFAIRGHSVSRLLFPLRSRGCGCDVGESGMRHCGRGPGASLCAPGLVVMVVVIDCQAVARLRFVKIYWKSLEERRGQAVWS